MLSYELLFKDDVVKKRRFNATQVCQVKIHRQKEISHVYSKLI